MTSTTLLHTLLLQAQTYRDPGIGRGCVDGLSHALQAASRAYRDGAASELVALALYHDVARPLDDAHHGEAAVALLDGLLPAALVEAVRHHSTFQGHSFVWLTAHFGGEAWYEPAVQLAAWDALSFDPTYEALPLSFLESVIV